MTKKELFVAAHKMTKEIKAQYTNVDYKFQLGLCLAYLQEGEKMVELKGSGKQIAWAQQIRIEMLHGLNLIAAIKEVYKENLTHIKLVAVLKELEDFKSKVETETNASWFIDHKFLLTHIKNSDYKEEIVSINLKSICKDSFIVDLMEDGEVKKLFCNTFYTLY